MRAKGSCFGSRLPLPLAPCRTTVRERGGPTRASAAAQPLFECEALADGREEVHFASAACESTAQWRSKSAASHYLQVEIRYSTRHRPWIDERFTSAAIVSPSRFSRFGLHNATPDMIHTKREAPMILRGIMCGLVLVTCCCAAKVVVFRAL